MESEFVAPPAAYKNYMAAMRSYKKSVALSQLSLPVYVDNQATIAPITSEASNQRSKHIDTKYKSLKDLYYKTRIMPIHVPTKSMIADTYVSSLHAPYA
jgi:hypothetical protein